MELTIKFAACEKLEAMGVVFYAFQKLDNDFEDNTNYIGESISSVTLSWSDYWRPIIQEFCQMIKQSPFVQEVIIKELNK